MWIKGAFGKLRKWFSDNKTIIIMVALFAGAMFVCALLWLGFFEYPKYLVRNLYIPKEIAELEDRARTTSAQILGGILVLISIYMTWRYQEKQFAIAQSGQVTDRFIRAVDLLNADDDDNLVKRLGGIYSLERIALDSPDDRRAVMEVLTAFVRTKSPNKEKPRECDIPADIQAILMAIGHINKIVIKHNGEHITINLQNTDLSGADISNLDFSHANLCDANLSGVTFHRTVLYGTDMRRVCINEITELTNEQLALAMTDDSISYLFHRDELQEPEPSSQPMNNI